MSANLFGSFLFRGRHIGIHEASCTYTPTTLQDLLSVPCVQMLISGGAGASESGVPFSMQMETAPIHEMEVIRRESWPSLGWMGFISVLLRLPHWRPDIKTCCFCYVITLPELSTDFSWLGLCMTTFLSHKILLVGFQTLKYDLTSTPMSPVAEGLI